ncbi:MAG TPA: hypothetical protein VKF83_10715 [Stellaceae bacterium]|nr:hypothetical protein [Stellaceae bacterium]
MVKIFAIQLLAAALGALSTAWADGLCHGGRIGRRLHAFWVSASIAVICLPVVAWTSTVFLGAGLLGQLVAGTLVGTIFLWVYRNLPNSRPVHKLGPRLPRHPSSGVVPQRPE